MMGMMPAWMGVGSEYPNSVITCVSSARRFKEVKSVVIVFLFSLIVGQLVSSVVETLNSKLQNDRTTKLQNCLDDSVYFLLANQSLPFQVSSPNKKARLTNSGLRSEYQNNSQKYLPQPGITWTERREYNTIWHFPSEAFLLYQVGK